VTKANQTVTGGRYEFSGGVWHNGALRHERANLSFEHEGARFHVWIDMATGRFEGATAEAPNDATLYKNPPLKTEYNGPGYFHTRHLDAASPVNIARIATARAQAGSLSDARDAYAAKMRAESEAEEAKLDAAAKLARVQAAGPALLAAAQRVLKACKGSMGQEEHNALAALYEACEAAETAPDALDAMTEEETAAA
jgi:hypothetical protein